MNLYNLLAKKIEKQTLSSFLSPFLNGFLSIRRQIHGQLSVNLQTIRSEN